MLDPIGFKVVTEGKTYEGRLTFPDLIAIERHYDISIEEMTTSHTLERLAYGAWNALRREGVDVGEFDAWIETVEDLSAEEEQAPKAKASAARHAGSR